MAYCNNALHFQVNVNFRFMGLRDKYHSPADLPMATRRVAVSSMLDRDLKSRKSAFSGDLGVV